jgi:hypothetical protein
VKQHAYIQDLNKKLATYGLTNGLGPAHEGEPLGLKGPQMLEVMDWKGGQDAVVVYEVADVESTARR